MLGDRRYVAARTSLQCCGIGDMSGLVIAETRVPCPFIAMTTSIPEIEELRWLMGMECRARKLLNCNVIVLTKYQGFCGPKVFMSLIGSGYRTAVQVSTVDGHWTGMDWYHVSHSI